MSDKNKDPKPRLTNPYVDDERLTTQLWVRIPWEDFARLRNIDIKKGIFQKTFAYLFHKIVTECKKRNIQDYADIERYEDLVLGLDFRPDVATDGPINLDLVQPPSGGTVVVPDGQTVYFSDGRRTASAGGALAESTQRPHSEPKKRAPSRPGGPTRRPTGRKKA